MSSIPTELDVVVATRSELDLRDECKVSEFIYEKEVRSVILSAAKVGGFLANSSARHQFLLENLQIQNAILSACLQNRVTNVIFVGSSTAYPSDSNPPFTEKDFGRGIFHPTTEGYAIAKFVGVKLAQMISAEKGWNYLSLIPCNLFGPFDNFDSQTAHVIPSLIRKMVMAHREGRKSVELRGNGSARREFLFSEDLAKAIWFFHNKQLGEKLLNIGTGIEISIQDLALLIAEVVGFQGEIHFLNDGLNGVESRLMNSKLANSMGWFPSTNLREGIERTVAWFTGRQGVN